MATAIVPIPHCDAARLELAPPPPERGRPFLTAEWRDLVMLSYEVDPAVLAPHVPAGAQLDCWRGHAFASIVGFFFRKPRLYGVSIPFYASFEEVNLRFYVRRQSPQGWRRGVVFIRELVPKRAVAWLARTVYCQNFLRVPMTHQLDRPPGHPNQLPRRLAFAWRLAGREHRVAIETEDAPCLPRPIRSPSSSPSTTGPTPRSAVTRGSISCFTPRGKSRPPATWNSTPTCEPSTAPRLSPS